MKQKIQIYREGKEREKGSGDVKMIRKVNIEKGKCANKKGSKGKKSMIGMERLNERRMKVEMSQRNTIGESKWKGDNVKQKQRMVKRE